MSQNNIESKIETLIKPIITDLNYELYDVQYLKEGKDYYLRITIDKPEGISIDDCENVNNSIDEVLDKVDIIKDSYFLEVSSPGIERILRKPEHFEKQIGNKILIKLFKSIDKQKEFVGILNKYNENCLELQNEDKIIKINIKDIAIVKTIAELF